MSEFEAINETAFEEIVEDEGERCLVLFTRKSCPVCQSVHSKLAALKDDYTAIPFYQVDVEEQPRLKAKFHLKGVPQTFFFTGGETQGRVSGDASEDDFADRIEAL